MANLDKIIQSMRNNANNIKFQDLVKVCNYYFGEACHNGTSHKIYKTPWPGDPRVNIQAGGGKAKPYQVSKY